MYSVCPTDVLRTILLELVGIEPVDVLEIGRGEIREHGLLRGFK